MQVGTVAQLWRYPVKSMAGERLDRASITARGIPGDRGWAVFDETRRGITNAKRLPPLRRCRARYLAEPVPGEASQPVEIGLPDGTTTGSGASDAPQRLSDLVGRSVSLRSLDPADSEAAPRVHSADDSEEESRALAGVLPGEPLADLSELPPERLRLLRQGNFFDALPIHILTRTTLRTLAGLAPGSIWDERRFRPNLLLEVDETDGYPELGWIGRRLRIGHAVFEIAMGCPRCVMTTRPVDELPEDQRIMRVLVRETRHIAGVYVGVAGEGVVRVGDGVELI
jgi:uncharacterized protein YcbX